MSEVLLGENGSVNNLDGESRLFELSIDIPPFVL